MGQPVKRRRDRYRCTAFDLIESRGGRLGAMFIPNVLQEVSGLSSHVGENCVL